MMSRYAWALNHLVDENITGVIGDMPGRWGRMTPLCRVLIYEVGRFLQNKGLLEKGQRFNALGKTVGLIGGTRFGSLHVDTTFIRSMNAGPGFASPALFGYTLPNIPLAEAASHYGLVGPVYAVFDSHNPFKVSELEARHLVELQPGLSMMLACEFDHFYDQEEKFLVNLTLIENHADSYTGLSQVE